MLPWNELPFDINLQFVAGDDFSEPMNLQTPTSGYTFDAYLTVGSGIVALDVLNGIPDNGVVSLNLSHDVTGTIPAGVYPWQMSYENLNGQRTTWAQGLCTVIANV